MKKYFLIIFSIFIVIGLMLLPICDDDESQCGSGEAPATNDSTKCCPTEKPFWCEDSQLCLNKDQYENTCTSANASSSSSSGSGSSGSSGGAGPQNDIRDKIEWQIPDSGHWGEDSFGTFPQDISKNQMDYTDNGQTITDENTDLMWEKVTVDGKEPINWNDAVTYCEDLVLGSYDDWRLPTRAELQSIVNYGYDEDFENPPPPASPPTAFDIFFSDLTGTFDDLETSNYWTSTTNAEFVSCAWYISFYNGNINYMGKANAEYLVRCVRTSEQ